MRHAYRSVLPPMRSEWRVVGQDELAEPDDISGWLDDLGAAIRELERHIGAKVDPPFDRVWIQERLVSEPWTVTEQYEPHQSVLPHLAMTEEPIDVGNGPLGY